MIDPTLRWQNGEKPEHAGLGDRVVREILTGIALRRRGDTVTA